MKFSFEIGPFSGDIHAIVFFSSFWVIVIFCLCLCLSFAYPNRCYVDLYDTHTHMCQRKFSWKTSKLRTSKNGGELERKGTERKSNRKQESRKLGCHFSVAGVVTAAHLPIHHIIASYRTTTLHHNHITSHWHNMTITSHHIISFDLTLRPTTWHHTASYRFPHHITTKKRNQPTTKTPPDGTAQGCCALKNSVWLVALRAFYRQFLCL